MYLNWKCQEALAPMKGQEVGTLAPPPLEFVSVRLWTEQSLSPKGIYWERRSRAKLLGLSLESSIWRHFSRLALKRLEQKHHLTVVLASLSWAQTYVPASNLYMGARRWGQTGGTCPSPEIRKKWCNLLLFYELPKIFARAFGSRNTSYLLLKLI